MKYINTYEEVIFSFGRYNRPKENDYVIINYNPSNSDLKSTDYKIFENFINNNIGKIIDAHSIYIYVTYENIPDIILDRFSTWGNPLYYYIFQYDNVFAYSKNKKELKYIINSRKYNL